MIPGFGTRLIPALYVGVVATLPLFSLRGPLGSLSIPLLLMLALLGVSAVQAVVQRRLPRVLSPIDQGVLLFLFIGLCTLPLAGPPNAATMLAKSSIYLAAYLGTKAALSAMTSAQIERCTQRGILVGTALFLVLTLFALWRSGSLGILGQPFTYETFTVPVFRTMDAVFGQHREAFDSTHVMRNAVGEAFAFYVIASIALGQRTRLRTYLAVSANAVLTLGMFSRSAMLAIAFGAMHGFNNRRMAARRSALLLVILCGIVLLIAESQGETRLMQLSDASRMQQYVDAVHRFLESPVVGDGYGAKLPGDKYVHNFVLAGAMMLGVGGLLVTLYVFFLVVGECLRGLASSRSAWTAPLLVIPLFGMTVGSALESVFTLTAWVALAVHDVCRRKAGIQALRLVPPLAPRYADRATS